MNIRGSQVQIKQMFNMRVLQKDSTLITQDRQKQKSKSQRAKQWRNQSIDHSNKWLGRFSHTGSNSENRSRFKQTASVLLVN